MFIIFNKDGSIYARTQSDFVMQGSNRVNKVFVGFVDNEYSGWSCSGLFTLPNSTLKTIPATIVSGGFEYLGTTYQGWVIELTSDITRYSGNVAMSVNVVNQELSVLYTYLANITINATGYPANLEWDDSITVAQFNDYMAQLATKLQANTMSVVVSENDLPAVGTQNVLYFVLGATSDTPYQVKMWTGSEYSLLGTINLSSFASKEEQAQFESELQAEWEQYQNNINSQITQIRGEVGNPIEVVATTNDLPSTNQEKIYVVLENGYWYYWNGSQYTQGQEFANSGLTINNLIGGIYNELNTALYTYIKGSYQNGDKRPVLVNVIGTGGWLGDLSIPQPTGNVLAYYDETSQYIICITSAGVCFLSSTGQVFPVVARTIKTYSVGVLNKELVDSIMNNENGIISYVSLEGVGADLINETSVGAVIGNGYAWYETESNKVLLWLGDNLYEVVRNPDGTGNYHLRNFVVASRVGYDNSSSGLDATTVQGAIDEVKSKSNKVILKQIFENNNLDTTDGFIPSSNLIVSNNIGTASLTALYTGVRIDFNRPIGHKIYYACWYKTNNDSNFYINNNGAKNNTKVLANTDFVRYSGTTILEVNNPSWQIINNAYVANTTTQIKKIVLIDLTDTFGLGNEPSASEIDLLLQDLEDKWFNTEYVAYTLLDAKNEIGLNNVLLVNQQENSDFSNGTENYFYTSGVSPVIENNVAQLSFSSLYSHFRTVISNKTSHKMYLSFAYRTESYGFATLYTNATAIEPTSSSIRLPISKEFDRLSLVIQPTSNDCGWFIIQNNYVANISAEIKELMVLDLTEIFGAGNEPIKEVIDNMVEEFGWFAISKIIRFPNFFKTLINLPKNKIKLSLPEITYAVVGDTIELFKRGIVNVKNPDDYFIEVISDVGFNKQYKWQYTPSSAQVGDHTATFIIRDNNGTILDEKTTTVRVVNPTTSPSSNINVLCIGDSLTEGGKWVNELKRRLTSTGGTPAGLGLTNITFVGKIGTDAKYEGYSGRNADWYLNNASSPFVYNGVFDLSSYCSELNITSIDKVFILLGWNSKGTPEENYKEEIRTLVNHFKTFNSNVEICLMGVEMPNENGLGLNYGSGEMWAYKSTIDYVFRLNKNYEELANELSLGFINIASQFDSDHNMPMSNQVYNTRNSGYQLLGTNGIHPAESGYLQIADAVYRFFNANN